MATLADSNDAFTAFWNDVLAGKFERFRNILLHGLSFHSAAPLASLALPAGAHAVDAGGRGDTALGPAGEIVRAAIPER